MAQTSAEKLEHTRSAEKEIVASVPQREQLASTPEPPLPKKRNRADCPEQQIVRWKGVKMSESRTSVKEGSERELGEESGLHSEGRL